MDLHTRVGFIIAVTGVLGIFISFVIQKSEFDPIAFALSMVSIFIAIVGIALILQPPVNQNIPKKHENKNHSIQEILCMP